ncbi:MAG: 1-acyl-sn-glycerol-3-phosphate acyltransferase [Actinobacteria bacterium]|nr:1-acyl-sn-glycerol-3-phosphate acyltransferase [Actinomycetota bacterium]
MVTEDKAARFYPVTKALLGPASRRLWKTKVTGLDGVPDSGPVIVAANHISFLDSTLLMGLLPRQIRFVGKAEYMDDWKTKHLFPAMGMIPIDRSGGSASHKALDAAAEVLDNGGIFGIYPEGTRSRDGRLYKGRTGVARLALRTGAVVVPVGIVGTDKIQPPGARAPKLFLKCEFNFGRPISPTRYKKRVDDGRVFRELTDEIMFEIRELCGQEYVHHYAGKPDSGETTQTSAEALRAG